MIAFINGLIEIFTDIGNSFVTAYNYTVSGFNTITGSAAVLKSVASVLPGAFISIVVSIVTVGLFTGLLLSILKR